MYRCPNDRHKKSLKPEKKKAEERHVEAMQKKTNTEEQQTENGMRRTLYNHLKKHGITYHDDGPASRYQGMTRRCENEFFNASTAAGRLDEGRPAPAMPIKDGYRVDLAGDWLQKRGRRWEPSFLDTRPENCILHQTACSLNTRVFFRQKKPPLPKRKRRHHKTKPRILLA